MRRLRFCGGIVDPTPLEGAIGLRNIAIIHGITSRLKAEVPRRLKSRRRILPFLRPAWLFPVCESDQNEDTDIRPGEEPVLLRRFGFALQDLPAVSTIVDLGRIEEKGTPSVDSAGLRIEP